MRQAPQHGNAQGDDADADAIRYPFDPWRIFRRALAGRYRLVCCLALFIGGMGAVVGWYFSAPVYRSEGMVRISSTAPQLVDDSEQSRPMAMFDAYLQSQQILLTSRDLLDAAIKEKPWQALSRKSSTSDIQFLSENLKVEYKPRTDYLRIFCSDSDPATAAAGVRSVINAYEKAFITQQSDQRQQRTKVLEDRRYLLNTKLEKIQTDLRKRVSEMAGGELEPLQYTALRAMKIDASLADIRRAIAAGPKTAAVTPVPKSLIAQMASADPILRAFLDAQAKREEEVARLSTVYGEEHPNLIRAKQAAARGQEKIDEYYRLSHAQPDNLKAEEASLVAQQEALKEMISQGAGRFGIDRLRTDEETLRKDLAALATKLESIDTEEVLGGRLTVMSRGDVPISPMLNRHLRDSAAGFAAGFISPILILVVCSLIRPRYRNCIQAASELADLVPMFTAVLKLKESLSTSNGSRAAARCVHQMRVQLTSAARQRKSSVYMVTSASSGEGKTNFALALGASFSACGFRTLVIDADLAGRGATIGLGVENQPGLREAADAGTLRDHIRGTREGLCILPTGADDQFNAYAIPTPAIEHLVAEAREMFQVIIIDTGAVFDCIEASMLAPWADGVIFVVAKGQRQVLVEQALQHLAGVDAKLAGVIFNGANRTDFERAMRTPTPENFFNRSPVAKPASQTPAVITGFGPVVDSVVSSLPLKQVGEFELLYHNQNTPIPPPAPIPKAA